MTSDMTTFSVTKNGKALDPSLYIWDEKTKTFYSNVDGLVLDFTGIAGVIFNTGHFCTFITGSHCIFIAGSYCTFNTEHNCTFNTDSYCTFKTSAYCTFKTGYSCTFNTGFSCTFDTGSSCAFNTDFDCTFKTGSKCTFIARENCFVTRCDVKGVTEIPTGKKIQLNDYGISGYAVIEEKKEVPTCNGKVVEIDGKKYKLAEVKE
jgi:hypothetical protein